MSSINITQEEAERLIQLSKIKEDNTSYTYPGGRERLQIPIKSEDNREKFLLDITRASIDLKKATNQLRAHQAIILVRVDIGSKPHTNPDGEIIQSPHIHLYKEGYNDKWAYPLPDYFTNPNDLWETLNEFMKYCNITEIPNINKGMDLW